MLNCNTTPAALNGIYIVISCCRDIGCLYLRSNRLALLSIIYRSYRYCVRRKSYNLFIINRIGKRVCLSKILQTVYNPVLFLLFMRLYITFFIFRNCLDELLRHYILSSIHQRDLISIRISCMLEVDCNVLVVYISLLQVLDRIERCCCQCHCRCHLCSVCCSVSYCQSKWCLIR